DLIQQDRPRTKLAGQGLYCWWWRVLGSNQRRLSRRFYRPLPLTTRATRLGCATAGTVARGEDTRSAGCGSTQYPRVGELGRDGFTGHPWGGSRGGLRHSPRPDPDSRRVGTRGAGAGAASLGTQDGRLGGAAPLGTQRATARGRVVGQADAE